MDRSSLSNYNSTVNLSNNAQTQWHIYNLATDDCSEADCKRATVNFKLAYR